MITLNTEQCYIDISSEYEVRYICVASWEEITVKARWKKKIKKREKERGEKKEERRGKEWWKNGTKKKRG